ncbi:MAG TPA: hypothetical protein VMA09_05360 [Candidatus Binataceae bacterium]|nr:hypothetical protein [Candidatus Binataceae bacterium]
MRGALCALALVMLLSFPVRAGHQFANHFRPTRVEQQIKRNTSVAQPEAKCVQRIVLPAINPIEPIDDPALKAARPAPESDVPENFRPVTRILMRIKLGPSQSESSPPLLS